MEIVQNIFKSIDKIIKLIRIIDRKFEDVERYGDKPNFLKAKNY